MHLVAETLSNQWPRYNISKFYIPVESTIRPDVVAVTEIKFASLKLEASYVTCKIFAMWVTA